MSAHDSPSPAAASPTGEPAGPPPRRRKRFSFLRFLVLLTLAGGAFGAAMAYWGYIEFSKDLPDRWSALTDYSPNKASRVYSAEGELIGEFFLEKRVVVPYDKIPRHVKLAFVAAEDNRFFDHHGVDPIGILRAAFANLKAGHVVQGGSTITQQVAKLMIVGNERNMFRKIREAILAHKIERRLTKDQILGIYLNHAYLGHGAYGVQAAAEVYFGKDVDQLTIAEAAMLGGLPKAPTQDSPWNAFSRAKERQRYVIGQMVENKFITPEEGAAAVKEPIAIISRDAPLNHVAAPYFVEYVRKYVQGHYGDRPLLDKGLRIYTTLEMKQQRAAEAAVRRGLDDLDRRLGFRGTVGHLDGADRERFVEKGPMPYVGPKEDARPAAGALLLDKPYLGMIDEPPRGKGHAAVRTEKGLFVRIGAERLPLAEDDAGRVEHWSQKRDHKLVPGDLIPVKLTNVEKTHGSGKHKVVEEQKVATLAQRPDVEAALVAVEPATGHLTAMVGGYDYALSQFNRAVQAKRQAGSSIKPYIYTAAIEKGLTEMSIVEDGPVCVSTATGQWCPHNYKSEFMGPVTLRTALQHSLNTVAVRLVEMVGLDNTIEMIRRFGITSPIVRHPSIALGVPELSPMEAAYAQSTFPTLGMEVKPVFITKIVDPNGDVLEDHTKVEPRKRRIPADTAYVMIDMMKNVVQNGTGKHALALHRPAAGKTGTSNDFKDNWFVGYTRDLLAVVWVGRDDFKTIGYDATGGSTACPIWTDFMIHGHPNTPVRDFVPPPGILFARADPAHGTPARPGAAGSVLIPFKRGTLPREFQQGEATAQFSDDNF